MPKIMIINVTHAEESRVGIVTDGVLTSFEIESFSREHLKGNLYKGVVHRIHQALEAAFVDIGAERDAFLPLDEICFRNLPSPPPAREKDNNGSSRWPGVTWCCCPVPTSRGFQDASRAPSVIVCASSSASSKRPRGSD